ncbi:MAG: hypothetical protein E6H09_11155 [Bacteroidetes bacterium]|jgi:hypothetical protein|nr:MAG: hypothetical protein E6H09_11155 [Bacteroidota bacterium]
MSSYQELLLREEWNHKRRSILGRDNLKCQNCFNKQYQEEFKSGLVFSNNIPNGASQTVIHNDRFIIHIWDMKNNVIKTAFLDVNSNFSTGNSYVCYYQDQASYANVFAIKIIENNQIELREMWALEIIRRGMKGKVTDRTFERIYQPIDENDIWDMTKGLHVHHRYYKQDLLPWQYPDDALITLCWSCHENLHKNQKVPILDALGNDIGDHTCCRRCHGAGEFPQWKHIEGGLCFNCWGAKYEELISHE